MVDFTQLAQEHANLSPSEQQKAGQALQGQMTDKHRDFVKTIAKLIQEGVIDYHQHQTFMHTDIYNKLSDERKGKVDLATINIADFLRHITEFYLSKKTPDESPHLETMIEQLWLMKENVEKQYGDIYIF